MTADLERRLDTATSGGNSTQYRKCQCERGLDNATSGGNEDSIPQLSGERGFETATADLEIRKVWGWISNPILSSKYGDNK